MSLFCLITQHSVAWADRKSVYKVRVVAEEKYDIIRELLDSNMAFRILHNNLDEMVAESIHKVWYALIDILKMVFYFCPNKGSQILK